MAIDVQGFAGVVIVALAGWALLRSRTEPTVANAPATMPKPPPRLHDAFETPHGADDPAWATAPVSPAEGDEEGVPALHQAAERGDLATVRALVDAGTPVDLRAEDGATALHYADGQANVTRWLLARGADPNAVDDDGATPILLAEDLAVVEALIAAGADPNRPDSLGQTPLHFAVDWGDAHVETLLAAGADPNAADVTGDTPLHWASRYASVGTVEALLRGGADPHRTNRKGQRGYDVADDDEKRRLLEV
jgi:ankyrin repeat protein